MKKLTIPVYVSIALGLLNLVLIYLKSGYSLFGKHSQHIQKKADGAGRLANGKIPLPANLTKSMLSEGQINDVIRFINVLKAR